MEVALIQWRVTAFGIVDQILVSEKGQEDEIFGFRGKVNIF
jgi:hypothetical protein